jgi:hypothetical protein
MSKRSASATSLDLSPLQKRVNQLEYLNKSWENQLTQAQNKIDAYIARLAAANREVDWLQMQVDDLQLDNTQMDRSLTAAFESYHELDETLDERTGQLCLAETFRDYEAEEKAKYRSMYGLAKVWVKTPDDVLDLIKSFI